MAFELMEHQKQAVELLGNGKILYGGVGTGKSLTALAYYMKRERSKKLYIITTAKKRDSLEWEGEARNFGLGTRAGGSVVAPMVVDSWNNIGKYLDVTDAFFIFDEQRLVGHGAWVKNFLKIVRNDNRWILLSATPGDTWLDYAPVFIANGFYRNISEFKWEHVQYAYKSRFPKVLRYINTDRLEALRNHLLVEMPYQKHTERYLNYLDVGFDVELWNTAVRKRWHPYENRPIRDAGELFHVMRKIVNTDPSRFEMVLELLKTHPKLIIFYNYNYELKILRLLSEFTAVAEWNGHRKQQIPSTETWVYLVQYTSGSEGWNCIETDAMVLYSLTYSYKNFIQCQGRIDRLDTPFGKLFYYIFSSSAPIDKAVRKSLGEKKNFNERDGLKSVHLSAA